MKTPTLISDGAAPIEAESDTDEMKAEYDFSGGVRGKYVGRFKPRAAEAPVTITLAPDVALAFPTEEAVNVALRGLITDREKEAATTVSVGAAS